MPVRGRGGVSPHGRDTNLLFWTQNARKLHKNTNIGIPIDLLYLPMTSVKQVLLLFIMLLLNFAMIRTDTVFETLCS